MVDTDEAVTVSDVPARHRFEILVAGERVGFAAYRDVGGRRVFTHTEIDPARGGQGLATRLIRAALDDARDKGFVITPQCSFVADFIRRHPDYGDLVAGTAGAPGLGGTQP